MGQDVTRGQVRWWKEKGYDLTDVAKLRKSLRNQERAPSKAKLPVDPNRPPPDEIDPESIPAELKKLEGLLINAPDYEDARMIRAKITGLKDAFNLHVSMGNYITKESQERDGLKAGQVIKQQIAKIHAELPQQVVGLDYPEALRKCEDFAHGLLASISEIENYE